MIQSFKESKSKRKKKEQNDLLKKWWYNVSHPKEQILRDPSINEELRILMEIK